jgi:hypothetical protein
MQPEYLPMPSRQCLAASWLAALALAAWGCAAEIAGHQPFTREDIAAEATAARESQRTRAEVREALGEPWLSSESRRIDVFRTTGKQRNALVIFAPYPIPLPSFSEKYRGFTLVSYDAVGRVGSAESGFTTSTLGQPNSSFGIAAGDYLLVDGTLGRTLSVSAVRFAADVTGRAAAPGCLLLVACDTNRPAHAAYGSAQAMAAALDGAPGACWNQLSIDGAERQRLTLFNAWYFTVNASWPSARARELGAELCREDPGFCFVGHDYFAPVQIAPGAHRLRFSAQAVDGELAGELSCQPGEVVFAKLVSETREAYGFGRQLTHGLKLVAATGRVEISRELPASLARHTVLIAEAGKWLLPEDAMITPRAAAEALGNGPR